MPYKDPEAKRKNSKQWKDANREAVREAGRAYHRRIYLEKGRAYFYKKKYGLEESDYKEMLAKQKSLCAICARHMEVLHVDHDHETRQVRGLLCPQCNKGLGLFKDSPEFLRSAAKYLEACK